MHGTAIRYGIASLLGSVVLVGTATAHAVGLSDAVGGGGEVPTWLTVLTGGIIVGASFLFTSLMTDHDAIRSVNGWRMVWPAKRTLRTVAERIAEAAGVGLLVAIVVAALLGPREPLENFAILAVWAGWWAGYTMTVYLVGNSWPALNPWRAIARRLPRRSLPYPERAGAWPAVVGLLTLVWIEVVSPITEEPRLLGGLIIAYTVVTLVGAAAFGVEDWFGNVDPISRVFAAYGRIAPLQRTDDGIALRLPATGLAERRSSSARGETAFVIALLWATTFDGFVTTAAWAGIVRPVVRLGAPPVAVYLLAIAAGFGLFWVVYEAAAGRVRRTADTYLSGGFIREAFAPSLLPIAAGYHAAHFLSYVVTLAPAVFAVALDPLSSTEVAVAALPGWFEGLQLVFILLGHMLAIWVAHSISFECFPGVLKPIRSQYPFVIVMILYTTTSMWIVTQPFTNPPYV